MSFSLLLGRAIVPILTTLAAVGPTLAEEPRTFYTGYAGSLPADRDLRAGTYFDTPSIRSLIYELERGPASGDRVRRALDDTGYTLEDLLRVGLIAERAGGYGLAFSYFTAEDMKTIHRVIEERVPSLAEAYVSRKAEFERILDRYPVGSVPRGTLAFILISGFSLNWNGLEMTKAMGFRDPAEVAGDGWRYSFWAAEEDPDYSTRGFYWGSSTFPGGPFNFRDDPADFRFSSFGDPYSDPRMNFPDLFTTPMAKLEPAVAEAIHRIGTVHETHLGLDIPDVLGLEQARDIGAILFALRHGMGSVGELRERVSRRESLPALLDLLEEIEYVARDSEGRYALLIPVLDADDQELVGDALAISRATISEWLEENHRAIRNELSSLTAIRQGVSFEGLFTQIWHDLFGRVTRELATVGLTADPRDPELKYQGSLGAVWRHGVVDSPFR